MTNSQISSPITLKQKSVGKDIIASGSVHTFDNKNLELDISGLRLIFNFLTDSKGQRMEHELIDEKSLQLNVFNFDNFLGTGTIKPIKIGTIDNRHLYLSFIVHSISKESNKLVTYTFFLGGNVDG